MNEFGAFISSLAPTLRLQIHYISQGRAFYIKFIKLLKRKFVALLAWIFPQVRREAKKMPQNPSLGRFSDDVKVCVSFYQVSLFSDSVYCTLATGEIKVILSSSHILYKSGFKLIP